LFKNRFNRKNKPNIKLLGENDLYMGAIINSGDKMRIFKKSQKRLHIGFTR